MVIHTYIYTHTHLSICRDLLVVVAIVGLFISFVSLSTCVTFRRNVFIMSAINQYAQSSILCTLRCAEGCRTSLLSNSKRRIKAKSNRLIRYKQYFIFVKPNAEWNLRLHYSFLADRIFKLKRNDRVPSACR